MNAGLRPPDADADGVSGRRGPRSGRGFTLIEVLVTAVVALVAIAGLATAQLLALRAAASSLQRSQATALAYEIVDRLRLNRGASGLTDSALGGGYDAVTLCRLGARHANDNRTCSVEALTDITGTDSVAVDLRAWWTALDGSRLPHWFAGLARSENIFTVSVQWDDARTEDGGADTAATRMSCLGSAMPAAMQEVCVMTQL